MSRSLDFSNFPTTRTNSKSFPFTHRTLLLYAQFFGLSTFQTIHRVSLWLHSKRLFAGNACCAHAQTMTMFPLEVRQTEIPLYSYKKKLKFNISDKICNRFKIIIFDFYFYLSNSHACCFTQHHTNLNFLQEFVFPLLTRTVCSLTLTSSVNRLTLIISGFLTYCMRLKIFFSKMGIETIV